MVPGAFARTRRVDLQIQQSVFARNTMGFNTHFWCCLYDHVGNAPRITAAVGFRARGAPITLPHHFPASLCISLSRLLQIIKRDWKSGGIREAKAPRRNGEDRSTALKHTPFAHRSDTHTITRCVRLCCHEVVHKHDCKCKKILDNFFAHPNDTQLFRGGPGRGKRMP